MVTQTTNGNENEVLSTAIRPRRQRQQRRSQESLPRQSLVISTRPTTDFRSGGGDPKNRCASRFAIIASLAALVCFWIVCFVVLLSQPIKNSEISIGEKGRYFSSAVHDVHGQMKRHYQSFLRRGEHHHPNIDIEQKKVSTGAIPALASKPHILSRIPNKVVATSDVRGNLGPVSVVIQAEPGTDWIHDRWQAASNMHGKQIPGEHWIQLEFQNTTVVADRIVLDWETAYADQYVLEASLEPITNEKSQKSDIWVLFDGRKKNDVHAMLSVSESGRSPGVKEPMPLHVVHEIQLNGNAKNDNTNNPKRHRPFRFLRLHILKSKTGWGVSLWQLDVYGFRAEELQTSR